MISPDTLTTLTHFGPQGLAVALKQSGYKDCTFKTAKFVGITNSGEFCYKVTYKDVMRNEEDAVSKVFLKYQHATDSVTADF